jgi:CRISPR-associated protein Cmr2
MSHLLAISVGPVQEFIAAARRTRDLWFGSYLLSEIAKAAAKSVQEQGGVLIFPHPDTDLTSGDDQVNVANVILAELPTGEPRDVAAKVKQAAQIRWLNFAGEAHREASGIIRQDIWDDQVADVIEFYAAWVQRGGNYREDRQRVMRLLAGRKNLRDFEQAKGRAGVPKSSLDGQRESVFKDPAKEPWPERFRNRLRLRQGEQLDVVGLVKRLAGGHQPYPSLDRVAADPWVRGNQGKSDFDHLKAACEKLPRDILQRLDKTAFPQFAEFPYEGTAVYRSRHFEWEEELEEHDRPKIKDIHDPLQRLPEPKPYLAVLVADGDRMGAAIAALDSPEAHREFSKALAGFANAARMIVQEHYGVLVYAGGDDVLAFLPVDQCLLCARALHEDFRQRLANYGHPTLSVGLAIGHFLENLEDLLDHGRAAEKAAKNVAGKDALAVHLHKRSGAPIKMASRWDTKPDQRLTLYAELLQHEALPSKLPYDLKKLIDIYQAEGWQDAVRRQALQKDALRIIADKQPRAGRRYMAQVRGIVGELNTVADLRHFCDELLIARHLDDAFDQSRREPTELHRAAREREAVA